MTECRIEAATEADLDAIAAIDQASFSHPWSREMFAEELRHPDRATLVVVRTPAYPVAGYCACWRAADELHVNTLAIRSEARRQRLATALLRHVLDDAVGRGAVRATLEVRRSNLAALALYRSFGFVVAGARSDYYSRPVEDALILWCENLQDAVSPVRPA